MYLTKCLDYFGTDIKSLTYLLYLKVHNAFWVPYPIFLGQMEQMIFILFSKPIMYFILSK